MQNPDQLRDISTSLGGFIPARVLRPPAPAWAAVWWRDDEDADGIMANDVTAGRCCRADGMVTLSVNPIGRIELDVAARSGGRLEDDHP